MKLLEDQEIQELFWCLLIFLKTLLLLDTLRD